MQKDNIFKKGDTVFSIKRQEFLQGITFHNIVKGFCLGSGNGFFNLFETRKQESIYNLCYDYRETETIKMVLTEKKNICFIGSKFTFTI